jgi:hypothetical protein
MQIGVIGPGPMGGNITRRLLQADDVLIAAGFDILGNKDSTALLEDQRFTLNMADIAEVWGRSTGEEFECQGLLGIRPGLRAARDGQQSVRAVVKFKDVTTPEGIPS